MLGPAKPRRLDEPIAVSLETLVPRNNFYRLLEVKLDLSYVRSWVQGCYAKRGRPSIDPVAFFKLQLILFFAGLRSERQLMRVVADRLSLRWYLGYDLGESLPDHSSLTRIRQRLGIDIFQRFFEQVVDLCQATRLVWERELYFDATKVEANAGIPSLIPLFYYDATTHAAALFADEVDDPAPQVDSALPLGIVQLPIVHGPVPVSTIRRGGCWRSGGSIRTAPPTAATDAPATSASAPPIRMPPRCGTGAPFASAITITPSSTAGSDGSSSPPSSRRPT